MNNTICNNKKAYFNFRIIEKYEAGIMLKGTEVKSLREKRCSLAGSYVKISQMAAYVVNMDIQEYAQGNLMNHAPKSERKLLLHKREIIKLGNQVKQKGVTLIPLEVFFNSRGLAKMVVGVATGKSHSDKRKTIQDRDSKRDLNRINKMSTR